MGNEIEVGDLVRIDIPKYEAWYNSEWQGVKGIFYFSDVSSQEWMQVERIMNSENIAVEHKLGDGFKVWSGSIPLSFVLEVKDKWRITA